MRHTKRLKIEDMKAGQTFAVATFGCRLNQAESRLIGEVLAAKGLKPAEDPKQAKIVVVNTCTVTHKADREVRKEIRRIRRENKDCFLIVAGCWVDNLRNKEKSKTLEGLKSKVDLFLDNKSKGKISQVLEQKLKTTFNQTGKTKKAKAGYQDKYAGYKKALVKIQTGCDNFCTYCIVPLVRGRSKSKGWREITETIRQKQEEGIEEVILTGVNLADFRLKKPAKKSKEQKKAQAKSHLAELLKLILTATKIKKISFGSMGLDVFSRDFLDFYKTKSKARLSTHFHIPLQSGCDKTLKRMGRNYTTKEFLKTIGKIKSQLPDFTFSTDLIIGFSGETDQEWRQTLKTIGTINKLLKNNFIKVHLFRYSARKGTTAEKMEKTNKWQRVDVKVKKKRLAVLKKFCEQCQLSC